MAAASSGDPGGSVKRRLPEFMDPTNQFGELTFLQMTGKDGAQLPINPYIIGKSVEACAGGEIEDARTEANGTKYTLHVRNPTQVAKLLKLTKLIDGTEVEVVPHPKLNISRCILSSSELIRMEEKDILAEMSSEKVIRVQRITKNEGGKKVNTPALILTFCTTTYPETMKVGLRRLPTRPYFPNPMLCYGCFSYGHTRIRCPGPQRCVNCSNNFHGDECSEASLCWNCKGDHRPTSRQCPVYKKEVDVIKIKVRENISFPEARKRAELQTGGSYAQVAAQQNALEKKLLDLEAAMVKKDQEIARLQEESKRKDEKNEQMMSFINQVKQQNVHQHQHRSNEQSASQEKPRHREQKIATIATTGSITRSRNNSPAIQETKRGRLPKSDSNKPVTSPNTSPPPKTKKATTGTFDLTEMDYSEEEPEVSETTSKQRFR
ncbi:uncharacterized protein LOC115254284 [Aedes albopictus]|uniref:CCHC-type domain-containing protein n=1 Tax=Aedes albopictus TaxID=7160 RepID=A0ABM1Z9I3_AEDAL|nr:uncharacterized protein LOC115254284 [Aedes albopictus]